MLANIPHSQQTKIQEGCNGPSQLLRCGHILSPQLEMDIAVALSQCFYGMLTASSVVEEVQFNDVSFILCMSSPTEYGVVPDSPNLECRFLSASAEM